MKDSLASQKDRKIAKQVKRGKDGEREKRNGDSEENRFLLKLLSFYGVGNTRLSDYFISKGKFWRTNEIIFLTNTLYGVLRKSARS